MPNLTLRYSNNFVAIKELKSFVQDIHSILIDNLKVKASSCRSLLLSCDYVFDDAENNKVFMVLELVVKIGYSKDLLESTIKQTMELFQLKFMHHTQKIKFAVELKQVSDDYFSCDNF